MKIIYLISTFLTLYLIYVKFKTTYDRNHDSFRIELLILPTLALSFIWNHDFSVFEVRSLEKKNNLSKKNFSYRFFGHFQFILNRLPYFLNYIWLVKLVKLKQSQVIICLHWASIVFFTYSIGAIVITWKIFLTGFQSYLVLFKQYFIVISFIFISQEVER